MMAYRSAEHETTGMSPNMLMFGRETNTPLDIMYAMPSSIKPVPTKQWVWEIQEIIENAHSFVREYTGRSMRRQKSCHDHKLSYESFDRDDNVYVFFPVKRVGTSSKFTSYWRGPFQVKEKVSDVLFKVDCGRSGSIQVIHVNRLRKAREQLLRGENTEIEHVLPFEHVSDISGDGVQETNDNLSIRNRKKPAWHHDYLFSISRSEMAKTKTTKRLVKQICPLCKVEVDEEYDKHMVECAKSRVKCDTCQATFKNKDCLRRHIKRHMLEKEIEKGDESDWDNDPAVEVAAPITDSSHSSETEGRMFRKRTAPMPVMAPVKSLREQAGPSCMSVAVIQGSVGSTKGTQTEVMPQTPLGPIYKCKDCGIAYDEAAMYHIHMGSHSWNAPFDCNVCGEKCGDKIRFQIHTTRSHRQ